MIRRSSRNRIFRNFPARKSSGNLDTLPTR
jgi:hypothetical protein